MVKNKTSTSSIQHLSSATKRAKQPPAAVTAGTAGGNQPLKRARTSVSTLSKVASIAESVHLTSSVSGGTDNGSISKAPSLISLNSKEDPDGDDDIVDPEAELKVLKRTWHSPVYTFFKLDDVSIQYYDGRLCHFFPCAARWCKAAAGGVRRFQDSKDRASTANLRYHAARCFGEEAVQNGTKGKDINGINGSIFSLLARQGQKPVHNSHKSHTNAEVRAHLVRWITENNRPANIINDRELRKLLTAGQPHIKLPGHITISRDIKACFKKCHNRIAKLLREHPGRLHFATDAWTSPNHRAFVAWTVHLEHQGHMLAFLLDIVEVAQSHTGATLATAFQAMLVRFGLTEKILALNADNATSNDTQTTTLAQMENAFEEVNRVRCFNHTLQLSAKTLLKLFNAGSFSTQMAAEEEESHVSDNEVPMFSDSEDDDEDDSDDGDGVSGGGGEEDLGDGDEPEDEDSDGIDELNGLDEEEREKILADTAVIRQTVTKVRQLSFAIIHSTTIALPAWRTICKQEGFKPLLIPRDVVTRWNSTYDMMHFALKYRQPIDSITANKELKLRKYELDTEDWRIVEDLVALLEQYKKATLFFSGNTASIAAVIPAMDRLHNTLNPQTKEGYHSSIVIAMKLAQKKLNRYYSKTDLSSIYRIAMVLHPGLKLEYFRQHGWEDEWIDVAENLVREEYVVNYEKEETASENGITEKQSDKDHVNSFIDFADISVGASRASDLDMYLQSSVENVKDPLKWWINNRHVYPALSRMALDYLSIPATSTEVERVFSQGRQLLHFTRNRLAPSSIRAYMCLGSWSRCDLLLMGDLLSVIKTKRKRVETESEEI